MFDIEDMSAGFHDVFLNKYADSSGPILDFFISDSMQDMLDIDIRTEVATVVGGVNEFTSLVNDIPSLDIHAHSNSNDGDIWFGGPKWSATNDIYADVGACVNPNSVMPLITSSLLNSPKSQLNLNTNNFQPSNSPLPSPKENKSHLTFSPNQIKVRPIDDMKRQITNNNMIALSQQKINNTATTTIETIKKDLSSELKEEKMSKIIPATPIPGTIMASGNTIKLAPGIGGLTFANSIAYSKLKQSTTPSTIKSAARSNTTSIVTHIKRERDSSPLHHINNSSTINGNIYSSNGGLSSPKILSRNILISANKTNMVTSSSNTMNTIVTQQINSSSMIKAKIKPTGQEYPKPAYSYSCLIAMALKNSRSGSLPVSEIYSFMCEHFPYFKTAPNGWKNSVRHNLSLNKCFEKIEKPATNGGQRKGCLWAMNPEKITKMDEEVQKWSRKDPMAIRKAMVYPEHLEALERGEMKHGSTGDSDGENDMQSDVEESSDIEPDNELDDQLIETPESMDDDDEEKFDIEVANIYDTIDMCDNKEALRMTIRQNELYDMSECDTSTRKKSRLDINYSIAPAVFDYHIQPQPSSQQHHNRRKMQLVNRIV